MPDPRSNPHQVWRDALTNLALLTPGSMVRVKAGWGGAGNQGICEAKVRAKQWWAVVMWNQEAEWESHDPDDPDLFKVAGLEVLEGMRGTRA